MGMTYPDVGPPEKETTPEVVFYPAEMLITSYVNEQWDVGSSHQLAY